MNVQISDDGFLSNLDDWSTDIAIYIAKQHNIVLTDEHWAIINFLRDFYSNYKTSPSMRTLLTALKEQSNIQITSTQLQVLFAGNAAMNMHRIAGLPKPSRCI